MRRFALAVVLCAVPAFAIVTPFIAVNMGVVSAGQPTAVKGPGGDGLLIFNKENKAVHVRVSVAPPKDAKPGPANPIPEPGWIQITPSDMVIAPHQNVICRMMVTIPPQDIFRGKTYEALILTSIMPDGEPGLHVRATIQSRLRFTVR